MMVLRKIARNVEHYGIRATVATSLRKGLTTVGLKRSTTVFLRWEATDADTSPTPPVQSAPDRIECRPLRTRDEITAFERIKFYDFVATTDWLREGSEAIVAWDAGDIMGYGWIHTRPDHVLPGLGTWRLEPREAWLGPDFVRVGFRGRRVHSALVAARVRYARGRGADTLFTAVNAENTTSLANFERHGFQRIGTWSVRRPLRRLLPPDLYDLTPEAVLARRLGNRDRP